MVLFLNGKLWTPACRQLTFGLARKTPHGQFDVDQQPIGIAPDRQIGLSATVAGTHQAKNKK